MTAGRRYQLPIGLAAVLALFYIRRTRLPGASPYELFLLLNILLAILFRPKALLASAAAGLVAAHALIALERGRFFSGGYWRLTIGYLVFSGLLLVFNHLGHKLSARVHRERQLKEEIVASSLDAIVSLDHEGRLVDFNRAAVEMFGYSRQEVAGQRMVELIVPAEHRQAVEDGLAHGRAAAALPVLHRRLELQGMKKGGTAFPIEVAIVRVDLAGEGFFVVHIRDITERKAHEQERERLLADAEKANSVKDDLLANLSHEFRTPLNAILGWSTMLRRRQVPPDRLSHAAEVIERNAQAQSRLVDDLLDASLAVAGLLRLQLSPVDVASALRAAADSIRPAASEAGLVIDCHAPANLGSIHVDAARLHQVFLNLLSNAVKFTPPGGRITVDAVKDKGVVTTRVIDTGVGIAPDFLPFVFERFRQADTSTTRSYGGVGLGLAVVKHLVGVMGGEISAESGGSGKGACFSVRFHTLDDEQVRRQQPPASYQA